MSDSIWKKEISLRRKRDDDVAAAPAESLVEKQLAFQRRLEAAAAGTPVPVAPAQPESEIVEAPVAGEQSIWRKEITLRRKPRTAALASAAADGDAPSEPPTSVWKKEISFRRKPDEPRGDSIWTKDISLRRREARQAHIKELADQALKAMGADDETDETEPWLAAPQLPPEPALEPEPSPVAAQLPAPEPAPAPTPAAAPAAAPSRPPVWKREISFSRKKKAKGVKVPKPARGPSGGHAVKRLVGLKVGASQLAAARVSNNGAAELVQLAREPLDHGIVVGGEVRDPEALAAALKQFFAKNKLPKKNVRLGIASNRIGVRIFDLVGIDDEKQLENAVRFRAQEALPIPIDEAVLDYRVLGETVEEDGTRLKRVLLVVAYRELVDRYIGACRKAGISVAGVDLEAFALLRSLAPPRPESDDTRPDAALVAVAIGHDRSTFAVSDGRTCEFTRVIEWGGATLNVAIARAVDLAPSEVEPVKRLVSLDSQDVPEGTDERSYVLAVDAVRKQVQAFARELVSSLQFYQHQPGSLGIGEIVITGGTAGLGGLAAELEQLIGVRVRVGDPLARMKVPKKLAVEEQIGSLAIAIGLGIED